MIGGYLGGRPLLAPRGWTVRPTPARVREAVFSALGDISGFDVADLYAGTGAMAIEAISRGAGHAVLVDRETRPAEGNVRHLELTDSCDVVGEDVLAWLGSLPAGELYDIVFLDPPYDLWPELGPEIAPLIERVLNPHGRVVVERGRGPVPELPGFEIVRERRYGRTAVTFHAVPDSSEEKPSDQKRSSEG